MSIKVNSNIFAALGRAMDEAEKLSSIEEQTPQQRTKFNFLLSEISALKQGAKPEEIRAWQEERFRKELGLPANAPLRSDPEENHLWRTFLLTGESRGADLPIEFRDNEGGGQSLTYSPNSAGATWVPFGYHEELVQSLTQYDEILDSAYSNQFDSETGQPMVSAAIDDLSFQGSPSALTFNRSVIVGETGQSAQSDVVAASSAWPTCPTFRSGRQYFSIELVEDSPILATVVKMTIARRHALGIGGYFITGNGSSSQPAGLTSNLPSSTVVTSAASTLTLADFENVYTALDPAYRKTSVWYMADGTRSIVTKLLETSGRALIGEVNELLRRPIAVCNSMNSVALGASAVAVLASKDYISQRFVPRATAIRQYSQTPGYIERGIIGCEGFTRCDQRLMLFNSGIPPVASLNVHS